MRLLVRISKLLAPLFAQGNNNLWCRTRVRPTLTLRVDAVVPCEVAWWRLARLREAAIEQPSLGRAFQRLSLYEQLSITLELLCEPEDAVIPDNVVQFRPRPER
jgi:hypothetical protein